MAINPIEVVDSHTEGEPTRVVLSGWPDPDGRNVVERRETLRRLHDDWRKATVLEPRGHDAIVGALLVPADRPEAVTGVIFFNDVSWLGMCGHGLIGVVRTLEHLGIIAPGHVEIDTPVGAVSADLARNGTVTIRNVPAYLYRKDVEIEVPGIGIVSGDVAWGGNWFFLTELPGVELDYAARGELMRITTAIRNALSEAGIDGADGGMIDHVELFGPPTRADADSRNFVLCPGNAYDRSPCGTGTSAKMASLYARKKLAAGQQWRQESIIGSRFTGWVDEVDGLLIPHIRGSAFVTARATLLFDPADPFRTGIS